MGGGPSKLVGDERLAPKKTGGTEIECPATHLSSVLLGHQPCRA